MKGRTDGWTDPYYKQVIFWKITLAPCKYGLNGMNRRFNEIEIIVPPYRYDVKGMNRRFNEI